MHYNIKHDGFEKALLRFFHYPYPLGSDIALTVTVPLLCVFGKQIFFKGDLLVQKRENILEEKNQLR